MDVRHAAQWFLERGFEPAPLSDLPESRRAMYDSKRNSKIYTKSLASPRVIDAEELFWEEVSLGRM